MEMNWVIMSMILLGVLILIVFLIWKNQKDKKKYEDFLNKEDKKTEEQDSDLDDDTY
jgi:FtsZ-interacting cell division protein ZipA